MGDCNITTEGVFAGPNADRAGVGYSINDSANARTVVGAAAFKKQ